MYEPGEEPEDEEEPELFPFLLPYWDAFEFLSGTRTKSSGFGGVVLNPLQPTEMATVGRLFRLYPLVEFIRLMRSLDDKFLSLVNAELAPPTKK